MHSFILSFLSLSNILSLELLSPVTVRTRYSRTCRLPRASITVAHEEQQGIHENKPPFAASCSGAASGLLLVSPSAAVSVTVDGAVALGVSGCSRD